MNAEVTLPSHLIPATAEFIRALIAGEPSRAEGLLGVKLPDGWSQDKQARDGLSYHLKALEGDASESLWRMRLIALSADRYVVGSINLKGKPDETGTVEIGWRLKSEYRGQGLATEAARSVINWAFQQEGVRCVVATIADKNLPSVRVAQRLGMQPCTGNLPDIRVWEIIRCDNQQN